MVFLNPWASTLKIWKSFCLGKEFLFKSILVGSTGATNAKALKYAKKLLDIYRNLDTLPLICEALPSLQVMLTGLSIKEVELFSLENGVLHPSKIVLPLTLV